MAVEEMPLDVESVLVVLPAQSGSSVEFSITGQVGSTFRRAWNTVNGGGEDRIQSFMYVTTSLPLVIDAGPCTTIAALNTTVFSNIPFDPRQLNVSSTIPKVHEHSSIISSINSDLISSIF